MNRALLLAPTVLAVVAACSLGDNVLFGSGGAGGKDAGPGMGGRGGASQVSVTASGSSAKASSGSGASSSSSGGSTVTSSSAVASSAASSGGAGPSCSDGVRNQGETDTDCGGPCPGCAVDQNCDLPADCGPNLFCYHTGGGPGQNTCHVDLCHDGIKDDAESDMDCGGMCIRCADGLRCNSVVDCMGDHFCYVNAGLSEPPTCHPDLCHDGIWNGEERGVDCGGVACGKSCPCGPGPCQGFYGCSAQCGAADAGTVFVGETCCKGTACVFSPNGGCI